MSKAIYIEAPNLSLAWAEVFLHMFDSPGIEQSLVTVIIDGLSTDRIEEDARIRKMLDGALVDHSKYSIETVANTIFPISYWNKHIDRQRLFERYEKNWNRINKYKNGAHYPNRNGTYFQRLSAFSITEKDQADKPGINQLEHIIETYKGGNHRRSALQASIFNPRVDHTNQRQRGFPCLQTVSFHLIDNRDLIIIGDYAIQNIFDKAYGNYLGLARLGQFMAQEMELNLAQVVCTARVAKLGRGHQSDLTKHSVQGLVDELKKYID